MTRVYYERWNIEEVNTGGWCLLEKSFTTREDAIKFIRRIRDNVIVRRIWIG